MEVILLQRIAKLGQMGDVVRVKDGYARNYLLPQGKALRANEASRKRFEREKTQLEARNLEARKEAEAVAEKLGGQTFVVLRQAGETGQLYGSVSTRDIAEVASAGGFTIERSQVRLDRAIKSIGMHEVRHGASFHRAGVGDADERRESLVREHDAVAMDGQRFVQAAEQADQRTLALADEQLFHCNVLEQPVGVLRERRGRTVGSHALRVVASANDGVELIGRARNGSRPTLAPDEHAEQHDKRQDERNDQGP